MEITKGCDPLQDLIINGTGNSRFLKSVADVLTLYPTYESFGAALAAGTFPVDFNGINPAGVEQDGTKLNKSTLLTDALCTALGLSPATATPTQAMEKLRTLVNGKSGCSFGSYVGNGAESRVVYLPGNAKAVILMEFGYYMFSVSGSYAEWCGGIFGPGRDLVAKFSETNTRPVASVSGSQMTVHYEYTTYKSVRTNLSGNTYYYICFY